MTEGTEGEAGALRAPAAAFGALLRAHRREAGLTQEALAERAGLSRRGLQHLEAGEARPYPATLEALAAALELAPGDRARLRAALPASPPPPGAGGGPADLPRPLTSFVGRERELAAVRGRLLDPGVRLVTLTGPGGVGKTRLALEAARRTSGGVAGGAVFVPLASLTDAALVPAAVARALGVRESGAQGVLANLKTALRDRSLLLVLDNLEHLLLGVPVVADLLATCPRLRVLATSRAVLRLSGEHVIAVPPLTLPERGAGAGIEELLQADAVRLFVERARAADAAFAVTREDAHAVAEVCRRLDGLPLALELAAARVRLLPPRDLLARLGRRLPLLTGGARDAPDRHRTLRAAIAWSHALLPPEQQALFRRLAVFAGGWTLAAAEAVGAGGPAGGGAGTAAAAAAAAAATGVLDGLEGLVAQSLVRRVAPGAAALAGGPRFAMLETVREFALEQLGAAGETEAAGRRHAAHCLALAEAAEVGLRGPDQLTWLRRVNREYDDLRAALGWLVARAGAGDAGAAEWGLRLAGALWWPWHLRGEHREGQELAEAVLAAAPPGGAPASRAAALETAGQCAAILGDPGAARRHLDEALALRRALGAPRGMTRALLGLGWTASLEGAAGEARAHWAACLAFARAGADEWSAAWAQTFLGGLAAAGGQREEARRHLDGSLALRRRLGDAHGLAWSLRDAAALARAEGDAAGARAALEGSLERFRELGDRPNVALVLTELGDLAAAGGERGTARQWFAQALAAYRAMGSLRGVGAALAGFAAAAAAEGRHAEAVRLAGAAAALQEATGTVTAFVESAARVPWLAASRRALGAPGAAAWAAGRALSPEAAGALALAAPAGAADRPAAPALPAAPAGLSPREVEVLRLMAAGRRNREIAAALGISVRTVEHHLDSAYGKLGVRGRVEATALALRHGLEAPRADPAG
jgi:non-specific serine/threonine protein kinase